MVPGTVLVPVVVTTTVPVPVAYPGRGTRVNLICVRLSIPDFASVHPFFMHGFSCLKLSRDQPHSRSIQC
jgi:hypothetical protein